MPRQIVVEIPDEAAERLGAELTAAITAVVAVVGNAAGVPLPVTFHHGVGGPVAHWPTAAAPRRNPAPPRFDVVLRGYDRAQVDDWVSRVLDPDRRG